MKSKNYKYILICGALLCNGVSSISVAHANTTDTIERKEETIITKEKQSMDALSVDLTWQDLEDIDHSKDTVKVQLLKNGKPYEGEVELGTTKWKHTWDFSNYLGWQNNNWELKVVKNKEGYKPQIRFNYKTNTFEFTNQQEKKEKNVKVLTKLKWSDSEEVDHNKDRIKVQWYKDGKPEGNAVELGYWIHEWVMTEEEANEKGWELKVVENKEGYEPQIKYDEKTRTYEITNTKITQRVDEKQSMDALSVELIWQDLEDVNHSKDTVKVQLLKNGKPYEGEVELGTTKWKHTWDFSNYLGWQNHYWDLKVVKNIEGYKPQIRFNYKTNTFEFTNQQEKKEKNVKVLTKLKWSDSEEVDHNKDRIKVQWYKDGKPEGNAVELGYWIHEWVMTEEEANEKGWELKVVENKEGYEPQIKYDEKTRTYEIVNMKVTGKLNITMSDKHENGIFLKGAVFEVKDKEGKVVGQVMTDVNGKASLELASGEYTIKQIKAPEGYQLLDDVYKVNVTKQGQKLFLDIKNQKEINQSKEDIVVDDIKDSQPKEEVVIEESVSSNGNREESKHEKNNVTNVKAEQKNASKKEVEKQQTNNTKHFVQEQKKSIEKSEDRKESKINEKETVNTSDKTNAYIWWLATASAILMMICSIKYKLCKKSDK